MKTIGRGNYKDRQKLKSWHLEKELNPEDYVDKAMGADDKLGFLHKKAFLNHEREAWPPDVENPC